MKNLKQTVEPVFLDRRWRKKQGKKLLKILSSCSNIDSEYEFCLNNRPDNFVSGKIATHINEWRNITSDVNILSYVKGYKIEFED